MLISFVVPVYNAEKTLKKCIESLLAQTFKGFEIILVNDGSTDSSSEICRQYEGNSKVRLIEQQNAGVSKARNKGVDCSKGTHICFVDSDDWVEKNYLEDFIDHFTDDNTLLVQDFYKDFGDRLELNAGYEPATLKITEQNTLLKEYGLLRHGYPFCKFYSSEIIKRENIRFYEDLDFSEDLIFFVEYLNHIKYLRFIQTPNYHYLISYSGSLSKSYFSFESELRSFNLIIKVYDQGFLRQNTLDDDSEHMVNRAKGYPLTRVIESMYRKKSKINRRTRLKNLKVLNTQNHKKYFDAYNHGALKRVSVHLFKNSLLSLLDIYLSILFYLRYIFGGIWIKCRHFLNKYKIV